MLTKQNEQDVSRIVVDAAYKVHTTLGPGLLESAYESCMAYEFLQRGIFFERQKSMPLQYGSITVDVGYKLDFLVEDALIVELKSVDILSPVHAAQILTYLKISGKKTGLLMNFNAKLIKEGIKRFSL